MHTHTPVRRIARWLLATLALVAVAILLTANPALSSTIASQDTLVDTPDGPRHDPQPEPVALPGRVVAAPASNPDDPYTHWRVEFNTSCLFYAHSLYVPVSADPADMEDIILTMTNWDVDYVDEDGDCAGGSEVDRVYPNSGRYLGILRGANDQWSTNSWPLQQSDVVQGDNLIYIDTDATGTGCWCVGVGWVEIKAKEGFQVKEANPPNAQKGVPFKQNEAMIDLWFNMDFDPETITPDSVSLYYRNQAGGKVKVPYTKLESSTGDVLRLQPNADLKDGVKYEIHVTTSVKNIDGQALAKPWTSNFWTLLDLEGQTADNKDKIETVPIQVAQDSRFIPGKPAVYRVFIRWDEKTDVHRDWQLEEAEFDVELKMGAQSLQQTATVKRPDKYTNDERRRARSSVNFYATPAGGSDLEAKVTETWQLAVPRKSFTGNDQVQFVAHSPTIKYDFWNVRANAWSESSGVPGLARAWGRHTILSGAEFTTDTFPVLKTEVSLRGDTGAFPFEPKGVVDTVPGCLGCRRGTCEPFTREGQDRWEWECMARRLWWMYGAAARANDNPWVSGMAPKSLDPGATGWQWEVPGGGRVFIIQYDTGADAGTVAHEAVHAAGVEGHIDNIQNVRGFRVRTQANKSFDDDGRATANGYNPEGNKVLTNLLNRSATPTLSRWIDRDHYRTLVNFFQNQAAPAAEPRASAPNGYLLLSGDIVDDTNVLMQPALMLDFATFGVPTYTVPVPYSIVQYSGATLLNTTYFSPTYMGDGLHVIFPNSVHQGMSPPPGSVPYLSFVTAVPFEAATDRVELQHNGAPIKTISRSANAPQVAFTTPASGATLSGVANIAWTASDPDGDTLYTMLQWSEDGGANYSPLTELVTGLGQFEMDTTRAYSTDQGRLKLLVTDGFNMSEAVINVTFDNTPGLLTHEPKPWETDVPRQQPISAWFNGPMQASEFISDEVSLECDFVGAGSLWISGTLTYDEDTLQASLTPFEPLPYGTLCTAYVEAGLLNALGRPLPEQGWTWKEDEYYRYAATWSFNTAADADNPVITEVFPRPSEENVPVNALVAVLFDDTVLATTITSDTLYLTDASGTRVPGTWRRSYDWSYNYTGDGAVFRPSSPLLPGTTYTATVTIGITDSRGNPLEVGRVWSFTTGNWASSGIRILGEYGEWVEDENGDGKYDWLMVDAAIESTVESGTSGDCDMNAQLLDQQGVEIGWATLRTSAYCGIGVYRKLLPFSGAEIRSHGVDGPYLLDEVHLYYTWVPTIYDTALRAYTTRGYSASDFAAVLTFGGLPDVVLTAVDTTPLSIDLTQYAWHVSLPAAALNYTLLSITDPQVPAVMVAPGMLEIAPPASWGGEAEVFVRADDGARSAVDSFLITRDASKYYLYLPLVQRVAVGDRATEAP